MAKARHKDPVDVVATIRRSIETSRTKARRLKLRSLGHLFGYDRWSTKEKEYIGQLLSAQKLVATPSLADVEADDWVHFTLAEPSPPNSAPSEHPQPDFFDYLASLHLETEKEVELHFISPLFHHLGYDDEHEAAGFSFDMFLGAEGVKREADLLYFADETHDVRSGRPLVLVECKVPTEPPDAGIGQAQAYSFWLKPAYYVVSNGDTLQAFRYLGGPAHDQHVLETRRSHLADDFAALHALLGPDTALDARSETLATLASLEP